MTGVKVVAATEVRPVD